MQRRTLNLGLALILTLLLLPAAAAHAQETSHFFGETGHSVQGRFLQYWNAHGGLAIQGYPISEIMSERSDVNGSTYTVQYFERAVFEFHPENAAPYDVLLTPLGKLAMSKFVGGPPTGEGTLGPGYFPETKHTVRGRFLEYWQKNGGLAQQGYPLTEELDEKSEVDGKTYRVQYFERAVFEMHPENKAPNDVLLSLLGSSRYRLKYGEPTRVPPPASTPAPPPPPAVPTAAGNQQSTPGPTLSGEGDQATAPFQLQAGLAIFRSVHTGGDSNFFADLVDTNGADVALVANGIGDYTAAFAVKIDRAGTYLLNVVADGSWTIKVEYPRASYTTPSAKQTFSGNGDNVTVLFPLKRGLARFTSRYEGPNDNFIVDLVAADGDDIALVANEIGTSTSSKVTNIPVNGVYMLAVRSTGDWTITIEQ